MLKGKTVIVTGGAKGIGAAICRGFAKEGANIALNYRSALDDALVKEIESYSVTCLPVKGDVSNPGQAKTIIEEAKKHFGSIDILVNNAGITKDTLVAAMSEEDFTSVINTNLTGAFYMIKYASKIMLKQRSGVIINISSVAGILGNPGQANYAASKAGLIGLTKSVAKELGTRNITCNAIAPGFIDTDMSNNLPDAVKETALSHIALKKFGSVSDIAETAVFLAKSGYITGQVICVDGGM